jgi:hypothetical protein
VAAAEHHPHDLVVAVEFWKIFAHIETGQQKSNYRKPPDNEMDKLQLGHSPELLL